MPRFRIGQSTTRVDAPKEASVSGDRVCEALDVCLATFPDRSKHKTRRRAPLPHCDAMIVRLSCMLMHAPAVLPRRSRGFATAHLQFTRVHADAPSRGSTALPRVCRGSLALKHSPPPVELPRQSRGLAAACLIRDEWMAQPNREDPHPSLSLQNAYPRSFASTEVLARDTPSPLECAAATNASRSCCFICSSNLCIMYVVYDVSGRHNCLTMASVAQEGDQ